MAVRIQIRRDTAANWVSANPTLRAGEIGIETDTLKFKVGTGSTPWSSITAYANVVPGDLNNTLDGYLEVGDLGNTVAELVSGDLYIPGTDIIFEGTEDSHQLTLSSPDVTSDKTVTLPNATGTVALTSDISSYNSDIGLKTNNLEASISGIEVTTSIDTASDTEWRTLKYLIQMTYSSETHSSEVILANDGSNLLVSQYGDVFSNAEIGSVTADKINGIINLKVTPVSGKTPLTVRFFRTAIKA